MCEPRAVLAHTRHSAVPQVYLNQFITYIVFPQPVQKEQTLSWVAGEGGSERATVAGVAGRVTLALSMPRKITAGCNLLARRPAAFLYPLPISTSVCLPAGTPCPAHLAMSPVP